MRAPFRLGLVGHGLMGQNHVRSLLANTRCVLAQVIEVDSARAAAAEIQGLRVSASLHDLDGLDGVVIASSTDTHFSIASETLERGIPTLVEKPMATNLREVATLIDLSQHTATPLTCGFVERFSPVVATAKVLISDPILHIRTERASPRAPNHTSNAIWDLLLHDLDLTLGYLNTSEVSSLAAVGLATGSTHSPESVEATYQAANAVVNNMCSRVWQRKVRTIELATHSSLLELDLLRQTLTVFHNISQEQVSAGALMYRSATTVEVPFVRHAGEPLALELDHFLDLIAGNVDPDLERRSALAPHALAEAIQDRCA